MEPLFSHRQRASLPRDVEDVGQPAWTAIRESVLQLINNGYFARQFPMVCVECESVVETNVEAFLSYLKIQIPRLTEEWVEDAAYIPDTATVFDLVELSFLLARHPTRRINDECYEECIRLRFNSKEGKRRCSIMFNRVLDRERMAFELNDDGQIVRIGLPILSEVVNDPVIQTGDDVLDGFLVTARGKFISRDSAVRFEGLLILWDAWERLKTLEIPGDKRASTTALLDRVAAGPMRDRLETEARELTEIGNQFMIRHSETDRHPLNDDRHVDYLFHRMFSLIYLLLDATGRLGSS